MRGGASRQLALLLLLLAVLATWAPTALAIYDAAEAQTRLIVDRARLTSAAPVRRIDSWMLPQTTSAEFTISFWLKVDSRPTGALMAVLRGLDKTAAFNTPGIFLIETGGGFDLDIRYATQVSSFENAGVIQGVDSLQLGDFYHFAYSVTPTSVEFVLNGIVKGSRTNTVGTLWGLSKGLLLGGEDWEPNDMTIVNLRMSPLKRNIENIQQEFWREQKRTISDGSSLRVLSDIVLPFYSAVEVPSSLLPNTISTATGTVAFDFRFSLSSRTWNTLFSTEMYDLYLYDDLLWLYTSDYSNYFKVSQDLDPDTWYSVRIEYTKTRIVAWVDGAETARQPGATAGSLTPVLRFGGYTTGPDAGVLRNFVAYDFVGVAAKGRWPDPWPVTPAAIPDDSFKPVTSTVKSVATAVKSVTAATTTRPATTGKAVTTALPYTQSPPKTTAPPPPPPPTPAGPGEATPTATLSQPSAKPSQDVQRTEDLAASTPIIIGAAAGGLAVVASAAVCLIVRRRRKIAAAKASNNTRDFEAAAASGDARSTARSSATPARAAATLAGAASDATPASARNNEASVRSAASSVRGARNAAAPARPAVAPARVTAPPIRTASQASAHVQDDTLQDLPAVSATTVAVMATLMNAAPTNYAIAVPGHSKIDLATDVSYKASDAVGKGGMSVIYAVSEADPKKMTEWGQSLKISKPSDLVVKVISEAAHVDAAAFMFEVAVMDAVSKFTPHTVAVAGWSDSPYSIVMKRYQTSLDRVILNKGVPGGSSSGKPKVSLALTTIRGILHDMASALAVLEQLGISHCDIKPANVLCDVDGEKISVYLNDYGCAQLYTDRSLVQGQLRKAVSGITPTYTAPEILAGRIIDQFGAEWVQTKVKPELQKFYAPERVSQQAVRDNGSKADVFSFGVSAFEVLFQQQAWNTHATPLMGIMELVMNGERPRPQPEAEKAHKRADTRLYFSLYADTIKKCWATAPIERPTFAVVSERLRPPQVRK